MTGVFISLRKATADPPNCAGAGAGKRHVRMARQVAVTQAFTTRRMEHFRNNGRCSFHLHNGGTLDGYGLARPGSGIPLMVTKNEPQVEKQSPACGILSSWD